MKERLTNTTIISHYRKDSPDRAFNLRTIIRFLSENVEYAEYIIVNDSTIEDEEIKSFIPHDSRIKLLFHHNEDHFKKAECFNIAAAAASSPVLCFYDVDILIKPEYLSHVESMIMPGWCDHVYPFNGTFINVKKTLFDKVLPTFDFYALLNSKNTDDCELASTLSPGGCCMISKDAFYKIGGFDPKFVGWGFEDTDFRNRSMKQNKVHYLNNDEAICWHLHHEGALRTTDNPHYYENANIFQINCAGI